MKKFLKPLVLLLLLAAVLYVLYEYRNDFQIATIYDYLHKLGWYAPLIYILLYVTATILFLPGSAVTMAGGLLFGPWWGTLYSIIGAVIGSSCAFLLARYIAADWVAQKSGKILQRLLDGVKREGWRFVAVVRLIPLFPYNLLNYALGLTPIKFMPYVVASFICMLPGTFAYTYVGSLGHRAISGRPRELVTHTLIAIGLLVLLASLPWFIKRIRHNNGDK